MIHPHKINPDTSISCCRDKLSKLKHLAGERARSAHSSRSRAVTDVTSRLRELERTGNATSIVERSSSPIACVLVLGFLSLLQKYYVSVLSYMYITYSNHIRAALPASKFP